MKTKNPPEDIPIHWIEHFAEINIGCKQPLPKLSSAFGEDPKGKDTVNH